MPFDNAQRIAPIGLLLILGLVGCGTSTMSNAGSGEIQTIQFLTNPTPIGTIQSSRKPDSTVHLRGKVGNRAPLLGGTAYELRDATGTIWILTQGTAPKPGDEVAIKGILRYQSIQLNGREQGTLYIEQQE